MNGSTDRLPGVGAWRQQGRACLWRYKPELRMYAGWHFAADRPGCAGMLELIDMLAAGGSSSHRTLVLTDPGSVRVDRIFGEHQLRVLSCAKLRLGFDPSLPQEESGMTYSDGRMDLLLDRSDMTKLSEAVVELWEGRADFSLGLRNRASGASERLSFWWWPRQAV